MCAYWSYQRYKEKTSTTRTRRLSTWISNGVFVLQVQAQWKSSNFLWISVTRETDLCLVKKSIRSSPLLNVSLIIVRRSDLLSYPALNSFMPQRDTTKWQDAACCSFFSLCNIDLKSYRGNISHSHWRIITDHFLCWKLKPWHPDHAFVIYFK